jgi:hypothetical protein
LCFSSLGEQDAVAVIVKRLKKLMYLFVLSIICYYRIQNKEKNLFELDMDSLKEEEDESDDVIVLDSPPPSFVTRKKRKSIYEDFSKLRKENERKESEIQMAVFSNEKEIKLVIF